MHIRLPIAIRTSTATSRSVATPGFVSCIVGCIGLVFPLLAQCYVAPSISETESPQVKIGFLSPSRLLPQVAEAVVRARADAWHGRYSWQRHFHNETEEPRAVELVKTCTHAHVKKGRILVLE